jgi:hypothetical protein
MRQGYLLIETHQGFPERVRLLTADRPPGTTLDTAPAGLSVTPQIRYAARFSDLDAALMHAHTALRRQLIDIDAHLYRIDPVRAVAAVEAIALPHRQVFLDPELKSDPLLRTEITRRQRRQRLTDRIWNGVGALALLLLLIKLLLGI